MGSMILQVLMGLVPVAAVLFIRWYVNRPEPLPEYSSEELEAELKEVFVERACVSITTGREYVRVILDALRVAVDGGLSEGQVKMLEHLVERDRGGGWGNAVYPVIVRGEASDLDLNWIREETGELRLEIAAVPSVILAVRTRAEEIPARVEDVAGEW